MSYALRLGRLLAWLWYYFLPIRRGVALDNVRRVFGHEKTPAWCRRVVRECFTHQCLNVLDTLRAPQLTPRISTDTVHRHGVEELQEALAQGRGAVLVTAHYGSMELAGYTQSIIGLPFTVIVKKISWKAANDFMEVIRTRTGVELIPARRSKERIREALAANKIVVFVVDQHMAKHRSIICSFFEQVASTSPAPTRFALECGSPIFLGRIVRRGFSAHHDLYFERMPLEEPPQGHLMSLEDAHTAGLRHNTQRINHIFEGWIREHPAHWLWLHRRWKVHDNPQDWDIPDDLQHLLVRRPWHE